MRSAISRKSVRKSLVTAPVSGTITSRTVKLGEIVEANKELMKVTKLSTV